MKVSKLLVSFVVGTFLVIFIDGVYDAFYRYMFGKSRYSTRASYNLPNREGEIVVEQWQTHLFLAEFDRTLHIKNSSQQKISQEVMPDTGGYRRINLYKDSTETFFLIGHFSKYSLRIKDLSIAEEDATGKISSGGLEYLGCFDKDKYGWRFITASERSERKTIGDENILSDGNYYKLREQNDTASVK